LIASGSALAFIGAGVTGDLQYPTWKELVAYLADQVKTLRGNEIRTDGLSLTVDAVMNLPDTDILAKTQIFKQSLAEKYFEIMGQVFGPKERRPKPISDLVCLPVKRLLTSNYDPSLEDHHAIDKKPPWICLHHETEVRTFMQDFQNNNYHRHIVHVHGRYDEPRYLVLTERDYAVYVQPLVDQFWRSVPVRGHFVFVGWSFNDADLAQNFRRFEMIFQEANPKTPRHFAIMHPISEIGGGSNCPAFRRLIPI